jgi:hypothetical protein
MRSRLLIRVVIFLLNVYTQNGVILTIYGIEPYEDYDHEEFGIYGHLGDGRKTVLGFYDTKEQRDEVVKQLIAILEPFVMPQ